MALLLAGCTTLGDGERRTLDETFGPARVQARAHAGTAPIDSVAAADFLDRVRPLLDRRCVVCHACHDAACQLKLTSAEGIERGASKRPVYAGRVFDTDPTRLHLDETDTPAWRSRGFHPVLNEREQAPTANLQASLMYRMLALKAANPLPVGSNEPLAEGRRTTGLKERDRCPTIEEFPHYADSTPFGGMPYALPALADEETATLVNWLASGARMANPAPEPGHDDAIARWEARLNGDTDKERLIARYVYEHLFPAHLHFDELVGNGRVWYRLVRSSTPPGEPVQPIATRLPFDHPGVERVWYRLRRDPESVIAKSHLPWALNPQRMAWLDELFFDAGFTVDRLPGYSARVASNPFLTFEQLPVRARYRFLLENSRYTIMGFMKGPVCRGQFALSAIRDHFWLVFVDPEHPRLDELGGLLAAQARALEFPSAREDYLSLVKSRGRYERNNRRYLMAKADAFRAARPDDQASALDALWDGDGDNPNAALTVFRHHDSSTVVHGLVGRSPRTAWLVDYPLLERIHYLLVAGFDVFGSVGHQLATRLYMEFLRQEGEHAYLQLLPQQARLPVLDSWYREADAEVHEHMRAAVARMDGIEGLAEIGGPDPETALRAVLRDRLAPVLDDGLSLAHPDVPAAHRTALRRLATLQGRQLAEFPEAAVLSIEAADGALHLYTVLRHVAHANMTDVFDESATLLPDEDTLDVLRGVVGDYPGAFWHVDEADLDGFVDAASSIGSPSDYTAFMGTFGVRRSHAGFWAHADRVHDRIAEAEPVDGGLLDFNRLENR